jgi:hypothetical protein
MYWFIWLLLSSTASITYATKTNLNTKQNKNSFSKPLIKDISTNITIVLSAYPLKTYVGGSLNTINQHEYQYHRVVRFWRSDDLLEGKGITRRKGAPRTGKAKKKLSPHAYRNKGIAAISRHMHTDTIGRRRFGAMKAANSIANYESYIETEFVPCLDFVGKFEFCEQVVLYCLLQLLCLPLTIVSGHRSYEKIRFRRESNAAAKARAENCGRADGRSYSFHTVKGERFDSRHWTGQKGQGGL